MAHQVFEQTKFARLQGDLPVGARHAHGAHVEHQVGHLQLRRFGHGCGAPQQRFDARQQFIDGERFRQVIVAAAAQAAHALVDAGQGRQHQHGRVAAHAAQARDDGQTIDLAGQQAVEHQRIPVFAAGQAHAVDAIVAGGDVVARLAQAGTDIAGSFGFVFDDQAAHGEFLVKIRQQIGAAYARRAPLASPAACDARSQGRVQYSLDNVWPRPRAHFLSAPPGLPRPANHHCH
ncbi:hypothetical protein D3C72_1321920 [compost metagenome]